LIKHIITVSINFHRFRYNNLGHNKTAKAEELMIESSNPAGDTSPHQR